MIPTLATAVFAFQLAGLLRDKDVVGSRSGCDMDRSDDRNRARMELKGVIESKYSRRVEGVWKWNSDELSIPFCFPIALSSFPPILIAVCSGSP